MSVSSSEISSTSIWIRIARIFWVLLALMYFGLFIAAFPVAYAEYQQVCQNDDCASNILTAEEVTALEDLGFTLDFYASYLAGAEILLLTWAITGTFIFLRRSDEWIGLLVSMALIAIGISGFSDNVNLLSKATPEFALLHNTLSAVGASLVVLLVFLFPDGHFVPRWTRYVAIPLVALALADPLLASLLPPLENAPGTPALIAALLVGILVGVFAQIQRYRNHSDLGQRQQTKWVIFGFLGLLLVALTWAIAIEFYPLAPGRGRLYFNILGILIFFIPLMLLLPISITFSILRYRLFDIDIIIKRTAVYGALTIAILVIYFATVVVLQNVFRSLTGQGEQLAIVASTLLIAALFNPLRGRIQTTVNRRFFRGDYDAAQALNTFAESVQDEVDLERMQNALISTVEETMQPSRVSLWIKDE